MIKTGLLFGSFNPIHIGHLMIANYFYSYTDLDEIWLVLTPQNPWKKNQTLLPIESRFELAKVATQNTKWIKVTDFEKNLEQPSFTFQSLSYLRKTHPKNEFVLIIGGDNYQSFDKWRNNEEISSHHEVWAFPRNNDTAQTNNKVKLFPAPQFEISSSFIRSGLEQGLDMSFFLPHGVYNSILKNKFYSKAK